jgi:S1-C subfamily serine protease
VLRGAAPFRGAKLGARNLVVPGDVILSVEGKAVATSAQLAAILDDYKAGDQVKVEVWREGQTVTLRAPLKSAR